MKARRLLEGCGAAILVLIAYIWPQVSPAHSAIYLSVLPMTTIPGGILVDLLVLSFFFALLFAAISFRDPENRSIAWAIIGAILLTASAGAIGKLSETRRYFPKPGLLAAGVVLVGLIAYFLKPRFYRRAVATFQIALGIIGFSIFWMAPELYFETIHHQKADTASFRRHVANILTDNPHAGPRRIVWLLFDELSYAQTFESRDATLSLPNFDRFREESISFSNLTPPGFYTALVVPSLLIGRQIDNLRSTLDGQAMVKISGSSAWKPLEPSETIFADAQAVGWTTGVAGWSNPYCRLFAAVLDSCFWLPDQFTPAYMYSHMSPQESVLQNAFAPVSSTLRRLRHKIARDSRSTDYHVRDVTLLLEPAEKLIADEQIQFVFIHLALPHPPGVYDRRTQRIRNGGSYLDNLALADRYLGELLNAVDLTRSRESTAVIVCSDHSWRIPIWKGSSSWTKEDEQAARKGFDPRPVLLVHFPEQKHSLTISQQLNSLVQHKILHGMICGNTWDELQLERWIAAQS